MYKYIIYSINFCSLNYDILMNYMIYLSISTGVESKSCVVKSEEDGTSTPDGESDTEYSNSDFTTLTTTDASKDGQLHF